jgi:hypothetical protein
MVRGIVSSASALVVGNFFDGVTAYTGAQTSSRLLRNSRLLSYAGWGHTAHGTRDCVTQDVNAYRPNGTLRRSWHDELADDE